MNESLKHNDKKILLLLLLKILFNDEQDICLFIPKRKKDKKIFQIVKNEFLIDVYFMI